MSKLSDQMKIVWANNFTTYTKSHGFHVNVVDCEFFMWHQLFEKVYTELQEQIDTIAEGIRTLHEVVPFSLPRIQQLSQVKDEKQVPDETDMVTILYADLETIKLAAYDAFDMCQAERCYGLQNILADYLQTVEKLCWMLGASMESPEEQAFEDAIGEPETKPIKM